MSKVEEEIVWRDPKELTLHPCNFRSNFPDPDFPRLVESVKALGVVDPPIIDEKNRVVAGSRRWRASLEAGLEKIPCRLRKGLTDEDSAIISLLENEYKYDISNEERNKFVKYLVHERGYTLKEIASKLGIGYGTVLSWYTWDQVPSPLVGTELEEKLKKIGRRKRKEIEATINVPRIRRDKETAVKLAKHLVDMPYRVVEEVKKDVQKGLVVDLELWKDIHEKPKEYTLRQIRIPVSFEKELIERYKREGRDFLSGVLDDLRLAHRCKLSGRICDLK